MLVVLVGAGEYAMKSERLLDTARFLLAAVVSLYASTSTKLAAVSKRS